MTSRRLLLFALIVAAAAFGLRLTYLGEGLFHTDSVHQARAVEAWVLDGEFTYMHRPGYPGQVVLAAPVFWLHHALTGATSAAFAVTLQSAMAGALGAGLMVLFARPFLSDDRAAMDAGFLAGALPTLLSTTTFAMSHGTQVALLLAAGIAASRAATKSILVAGTLLGLAIATRTESALFAPAILALAWRERPPIAFDGEKGLHLTASATTLLRDIALLAVPMLAVPLALYAPQFADVGLAEWREASRDTGWLGPVSTALPRGLDGARRSLTWGGAAIALVGLVLLWRRDRSAAGIVLLWCLLPFVVLANTQIVVPRHLIPALVVLAVPIAVVLEAVARRSRAASGVALWVLVLFLIMPVLPTLSSRSNRCLPAAYAKAVGELVSENGIVVAMDLRPHLEYFGAVETLGRDALDGTADDERRIAETLATIRARLEAGTAVFITSDAFAYDVPHPEHGLVRVEIGSEGGGKGEEALGRFGIALLEAFEMEHMLTTNYEDWHGASLGPRPGAPGMAHLYRIVR